MIPLGEQLHYLEGYPVSNNRNLREALKRMTPKQAEKFKSRKMKDK